MVFGCICGRVVEIGPTLRSNGRERRSFMKARRRCQHNCSTTTATDSLLVIGFFFWLCGLYYNVQAIRVTYDTVRSCFVVLRYN